MTRPSAPRRPGRPGRVVAGLVAALAFLLGPASGTASAHGGPGRIEVLGAAVSGSTVEVRVKVTFTGDGHAAEEATVTVAGSSDGGELTPVTLSPVDGEPGVYSGAVTLPSPGGWSLRVTSVEPPATATVPVGVDPPSAAAPVTAATGPSTTPTTDPSTAGDAGGVTDDAAVTSAPADAEEGGGGSPWVWVLGGAGALVAVAVGAVFVANGRRSGID